MILVNAQQFPGPALWQGIMLMLLPLWVFAMYYKDGRYFKLAMYGYGVIGLVSMLLIMVLVR
ncbi:hypothetical protein [Trinickia symbiotica]|uniref:Uncharacterized protein n=1 Tax=Trinickia symbiotica TaxID=863227 RepID=A0A2N7X9P3_9BURK|nr:hypothetical protein [Trinickia symbiotica]PMS38448.1 hypothetical protein C0Z20_00755 [Trinickia symbiotica]